MMKNENPTVIYMLFALFISGCAFGDRTVNLSYPPEGSLSRLGIPTAEAATIADYTLILTPFEDKRSEGKLIGEVLNGYGIRTADVLVANEVGAWVTNALRQELENAGYKVQVLNEGKSSEKDVLLTGEVGRVFCTAYLQYEGDVGFEMRVVWNGQEIFTKRYLGHQRSGVSWAMTSKSYNNILALALRDAIRRFIDDLNEAFTSPTKPPKPAKSLKTAKEGETSEDTAEQPVDEASEEEKVTEAKEVEAQEEEQHEERRRRQPPPGAMVV